MRKFILLFLLVGIVSNTTGQGNKKKNGPVDIIHHTVELGETIRMLSKKYLVNPADIYFLNHFAVNGIKQGMVLQIPVPRKSGVTASAETPVAADEVPVETPSETAVTEQKTEREVRVMDRVKVINYTVRPHETLYGIAQKHHVSADEIKLSNSRLLKGGLKAGMTIKIPMTRVLSEGESTIGTEETPSTEVSLNKNAPKK
jgi:LysM repeat protein